MKTPTLFKTLLLSFVFIGLPMWLSAQADTIRQFVKWRDSFTLSYPGVEPNEGTTFQWFNPDETPIDSPDPSSPELLLGSVDTTHAGIYRIQSINEDFPNDIEVLGYIDLDLLCRTNNNEGPGCYVCRELIVQIDNPSDINDIEQFFFGPCF